MRREPTPQSLEFWGEFLHRLNRSAAAIAAWRQLADAGTASTAREAAHVMQRYGYLPAALQVAQTAVDRDPNDAASWQTLLDVQLARQDYDAALGTIQQMQTLRPHDAAWQRDVAQARATTIIAAGRIEPTIVELRRQLAQQPDDLATTWALAQLLEAAGEREEALGLFERLARPTDADPNLIRRYAAALVAAAQPAAAIEQFLRLIDKPTVAQRDDYQRLIELQLRQDQHAAAATAAQFVRNSPRDAEAYLLQAQVAATGAHPAEQLAALQRAVQVAPEDVAALRQYAQALVDAGQPLRCLGCRYATIGRVHDAVRADCRVGLDVNVGHRTAAARATASNAVRTAIV